MGMECARFVSLLSCLCGCALGTPDSPSRSSTVSPQERILEQQVAEAWHTCVRSPTGGDATALCVALPDIRECFSREEAKWNQTHGEAINRVAAIFRGVAETATDRMCRNNAETLTAFLHENTKTPTAWGFLFDDVKYFTIRLVSLAVTSSLDGRADFASNVWYFYHHIRRSRDFFKEIIWGADSLKLVLKQFDAVLRDMKCLRPLDESVVLCRSLHTELTDKAQLCPLKTTDLAQSIEEAVMSKAIDCFRIKPPGLDLSKPRNLQQFREYFKSYCLHEDGFRQCISLTETAAEICLNQTDLNNFNHIGRYLKVVQALACGREGKILSKMFYRFYVSNNKTNVSARLIECLEGTLVGRPFTLDIVDYLEEMPDTCECLLDKMPRDAAFQSVVKTTFTSIFDNSRCF